ncbi:helix-turn-helix domain-containing protein [Ureibacillus sinduriensis]|uniref:XRE family transcriptional regulator n=1 Tax=Ureibacillus sinduriensis BLB-1 = JCM 15800 TaxID=1384057 RepID=A0A0A3HRK2_9BACL|nr:XRE family transcriptional regulator [Ureibacillus sinduriensis BLB-1 = JCM 15800]
MLKQKFHEQLKFLREERDWSLEDLSKKVQVGVEKLAQYEKGELIPSVQTILKLSTALEVPASNLMDGIQS